MDLDEYGIAVALLTLIRSGMLRLWNNLLDDLHLLHRRAEAQDLAFRLHYLPGRYPRRNPRC